MKIHFVTSRESIENDIETLQQIIKTIRKSGHKLANNWIDKAASRQKKGTHSLADWKQIYRENLENVTEADVLIAEVSHDNFGVGYQVATAVRLKKPVLLLRRESADKGAFVSGVEDSWVQYEEYNDKKLEKILRVYIKENDIKTKDMRFNFFIDRKIYNYLEWSAHKTGTTKAFVLRKLVQEDIERRLDEQA